MSLHPKFPPAVVTLYHFITTLCIIQHALAVTNDSYITATEVCDMLRKIAAEYAEKEVHLVLDNARYQKCQAVRELAGQLGIHLK